MVGPGMASMSRVLRRLPATRLAAGFSTSGPPQGSQPASWSVAAKVSAAALCTGSASLLWTWASEQEKSEKEEKAASFDADHYKNGVNANFLSGSENDILATYGGPCGRFENPETRDIAKGKDAVLAALGRVYPLEGKVRLGALWFNLKQQDQVCLPKDYRARTKVAAAHRTRTHALK